MVAMEQLQSGPKARKQWRAMRMSRIRKPLYSQHLAKEEPCGLTNYSAMQWVNRIVPACNQIPII